MEISDKTVTISLKSVWVFVTAIIFYTVSISGMYFGLNARITNNEKKLVEHQKAVTELGDLKADMREVKVRLEEISALRKDLEAIDIKIDKLIAKW